MEFIVSMLYEIGTPPKSKSVFSNLMPSPVLAKENEFILRVKKYLNAFEAQSIQLCFNSNKMDTTDANQIIEALSNLTCRDIKDLFQEIDLHDGFSSSNIDFKLDELMEKSEPACQNSNLTTIARNNIDIFDTHFSNSSAQYLCVSPASNDTIGFNTKPDLIHGRIPMMLEIKSRITNDKKKSMSSKMSDLNLSSAVPSNNITLTELDLFQQCLERILEQAQFRAYLSKLVVLGSTGHTSWCFYYTQNFQGKGSTIKQLTVSKITNRDVNNIWNGMTDRVRSLGSAFYLTKHAPVIAKTLQCLFPGDDLNSIRINVASCSQSVVYYVTPPDFGKTVNVKRKLYALKVISDKAQYHAEVDKLEKIKIEWEKDISDQRFYYVTHSDSLFKKPGMTIPMIQSKYSWLATSYEEDYHIILMLPALRISLYDVVDTTGQIYSELLRSLAIAHKAGVLHCDLSPNNCLKFSDGWQVIDYGLSVNIENKDDEDWMTNYSGGVSMQRGSYQHRCCGQRAFEIISESEHIEIEFDWTVADDLEMLQRACSKQKR